jgi:uncharacterized repeat protein (TIGR01451 family)
MKPLRSSFVAVSLTILLGPATAFSLTGDEAVAALKQRGAFDSVKKALETARYEINGANADYQAANPAHDLRAWFTPQEARIMVGGNQQAALRLERVGNKAMPVAQLVVSGNRVEYRRGTVTEWYLNDPRGLEQGFIVEKGGDEPLTLSMAVDGDLNAELSEDERSILFRDECGHSIIAYGGLKAWDACGMELPARLALRHTALAIEIEDAGAVYPVTIDPLITSQVAKLTASDAFAGNDFGLSVGISGDTLVVGGDGNNNFTGAAYVFARNTGGAEVWGQVKKLTASDAGTFDSFGRSVDISGDTIVVGAANKNSSAGAAYVFSRNTGGADNWGEVKKITASDAAMDDGFGQNISISDDTVVVGATGKSGSTGAVYVFSRNTGGANNWGQVKKVTASDGALLDSFGWSLALSRDTLVVGAIFDDTAAGNEAGSAYVFGRNVGGADNWGQVKKLAPADAAANDLFGQDVAISGDTVVVGSANHSAYVFERNSGGADNWGQQKKITGSDAEDSATFGIAVAISGDTIVVGASGKFVGTNSFAGAAYIYERNLGGADNWGEAAKIFASDAATDDDFGNVLAISGDTIVVGADQYFTSQTGQAYTFVRSGNNWVQRAKPTASDGVAFDFFGLSVSLSGDTLVVGAENAGNFAGAAYVFGRNSGGADNWGQIKKLLASDAVSGDSFGRSVSISGDTLAIGANFKNSGIGGAYVFGRNTGGADNWGQIKILTANDATNDDRFGISISIDSDTLIVGANGKSNDTGAAYVFARNTGGADNWGQVKKLRASDPAVNDSFGESVFTDCDSVAVGAPGKTSSTGAVYIYGRNTGGADNWGQVKKVTATGGFAVDIFGEVSSLSGDTLAVGARGADAAYVFDRNQGGADNWGQVKKITGSDALSSDEFGGSVSLSIDTLAVGAYATSTGGAVYVFERNFGGANNWGETKKVIGNDAAPNDTFGGSVSIDVNTLLVGANGKNSLAGAAYVFERTTGGVTNNTPPVFTSCPGNITVGNDLGQCSASVSFNVAASGNPTPTVECKAGATVITSPHTFAKGISTVTCTASNSVGTTNCIFTVTVNDTELPAISCHANIISNVPQGQTSAIVTFGAPTASDNCALASTNCSPASGTSFGLGTTPVTCTAVDTAGKTNTCMFTVTVTSTTGTNNLPVAQCHNVTVNASASCQANVTGAQVNNGSSDPDSDPLTFSLNPPGPYSLGDTPVTLTVDDNRGGTDTCNATITVEDHTPPTVGCPGNITVSVPFGQPDAVVNFTVSFGDNCSLASSNCTPASGATFPVGTTPVLCTAMDGSGNTNSCTFTVTVNQGTPSSDLAVSKSASPETAIVGNDLTYTLVVTNLGPNTATSVTVTDRLPAQVTFVSATPSQGACTQIAGIVTCDLGNVATRATVDIIVNPTDIGSICNTAVVAGVVNDPNSANNTASICTEVHVHDLAVISIKAAKSVTLTSKKTSQIKFVRVTIQNRSDHDETIQNLGVLSNLVTLVVESLGTNCPNPDAVFLTGPPQRPLPVTLKPKQKFTVIYNVTYDCANDPAKGEGHEDLRYLAAVHHEAIDGLPDNHTPDDMCPHNALPGGIDPFPNGKIKDNGCGSKKPDGTLGADVVTDVVVK